MAYLWKLDKLKKQRLIELQEKAEKENAELKDVIEILSELFLSQSQYNKEVLNHLNDINLSYQPIELIDIGIDKKTKLPIPLNLVRLN